MTDTFLAADLQRFVQKNTRKSQAQKTDPLYIRCFALFCRPLRTKSRTINQRTSPRLCCGFVAAGHISNPTPELLLLFCDLARAPERSWLLCLFTSLRAEARAGLNKTLAKYPGETREHNGKLLAVCFPSLFALRLFGLQIRWRLMSQRGQGQLCAESTARESQESSSAAETEPFSRDQNISL